jgi:hypothetical protein
VIRAAGRLACCLALLGPAASTQPNPPAGAATPATRTLTPAEADRALERDWLFQAIGEPLRLRTARELGWTRALAHRLGRAKPAPDLAADLNDLDALDRQLADLPPPPPPREGTAPANPDPNWIWFPAGDPTQDAPATAHAFRCRFELPASPPVLSAELRVAADDACEVFLNGRRIGAHSTWQRAATFAVGTWLRPGTNLLAIRADNRPAPSKNPAGLIARLDVGFSDTTRQVLISDGAWRVGPPGAPQWDQPTFNDDAWQPAAVAAPYGGGPWGRIAGLGADVPTDPFASYAAEPPAIRRLYLAVRRLKRALLFKNPALDFTQLLLIDQPLPQGPINPEHEAIHRMGITAVPGGRLLVLDGLHPGGRLRQLAPTPPHRPGSFWRPDLAFDARRVVFCFKPADERSFHLYEINFDGTGLRQLTHSEYDDIDPLYLPDGHILFTTTRANSYVRCGPFIYSYTLARCDADGGNVYLISCNGEPDFVPALLPDGRVIYSRWEYSDKPLWRLQKLWTTNPDGTGTAHFWGNQSVWPDHLSEPRPIPGTRRVMFAGVGHHDWWSGSIGIIDPDQGRDWPRGLTKVTADLRWPEVTPPPIDLPESADYHPSGRFTGYKTPFPISDRDFLVSARGFDGRFRLYLMDVHGNRDLVFEGAHNIWHAVPVRPRPAPPPQTDRVAWPGTGKDRRPVASGFFYSADVCEGVPDLPRDRVRYLRVLQLDYKTYSTWNKTYRHSGPPVSIVQEEGVKRILSEVPVESDGSVYFEAPAGRALFFQLLDGQRRCLQTMRSFAGLMPGERRGCVGCHEGRSTAPTPHPALALRRPPTPLSPPPWGDESIGFERFAQPVLDRYCVRCHQGRQPGPAEPNLVLRPGHSVFKEPYLTLVGAAGWGNPVGPGRPGYGIAGAIPVESQYDQNDPKALTTLPPLRYLSANSRLVDLAANGTHYDVRVDPASLHRLIAWVDACCPFMGEPELRALGDPDFPGISDLPIRPRVASAPTVQRP